MHRFELTDRRVAVPKGTGIDPPLQPDGIAQIHERAKSYLAGTPRLSELRQRLLDLGGQEVIFVGPEPDLDALLERGHLFSTRRRRHRFIADHRCHENAATLWYESEGRIGIATGYALSGHGWVPHSWGVEDGTVLEMTDVRWQRYFGIALTDPEALRFALANLRPGVVARIQSDAVQGRWPLPIFLEIVAGIDGGASH